MSETEERAVAVIRRAMRWAVHPGALTKSEAKSADALLDRLPALLAAERERDELKKRVLELEEEILERLERQ